VAVATVTVATCLVICNALSCVHELLCMAFVITKGMPEMLKYDSNYLVGSSFDVARGHVWNILVIGRVFAVSCIR